MWFLMFMAISFAAVGHCLYLTYGDENIILGYSIIGVAIVIAAAYLLSKVDTDET